MDEVMMRMRASVMATPVRPAMVVNMTMVGFCTKTQETGSSLAPLCLTSSVQRGHTEGQFVGSVSGSLVPHVSPLISLCWQLTNFPHLPN